MTLTPVNDAIIKNLCLFIKNNQSLIMLDLSNTKLIEPALNKVVRSCRRAISLQSINLSCNPGIYTGFTQSVN